MSNLATAAHLQRASSQLPVSWYFDRAIHDIEQASMFEAGPSYVGHELMVPNVGDYQVLSWRHGSQVLVRRAQGPGGIELLSNVCRHRQALMLQDRGNVGPNIVCPVHRWTYDLEGKLLGAPHFAENPCLHLPQTPLANWNGLLFDGKRDVAADLANLGVLRDFDFSGYVLDRIVVDELACNWKTFIEVYLEDYHVVPYHPGLGNFVTCDDLEWEFADEYSVQTVGINNRLARPGSEKYARWHKAVLDYYDGQMPAHGAIWVTYYPNIMLEWYPHVLVVSAAIPRGPEHTTNVVEFYYPEELALFEREFVEAEQAAYEETAREDEEICARMDGGRRALHKAGRNEYGPYQSPMEDGMQHFHEWVRRRVEPAL